MSASATHVVKGGNIATDGQVLSEAMGQLMVWCFFGSLSFPDLCLYPEY